MGLGMANAATLNVNGTCTLINALQNANADADLDGGQGCPAGSGADTINLAANKIYTLSSVNNLSEGPNGLPAITSTITINGNGATVRRSNAPGTPDFRLLRVVNGAALTLNSVKLQGGRLTAGYQYGAAIRNGGQLTLNDSTITGNTASGTGSSGSGIAGMYQSVTTLNNSTISGNTATHGGIGGIGNGGIMTLTNSTVSGNRSQAAWGSGGISNSSDGTLTLNHVTLSDNSTDYGNVAGLANSGSLTLINSVIANSKNGADCYTNFRYGGRLVFQGKTIIEDGTCSAALSGDPKLATLLDNGGPTQTQALRKGSAALNAADAYCVAIDQRYVSRPQPDSGVCDLGAYERISSKAPEIAALLNFFDAQTSAGGLVGVGNQPGYKLDAVRSQLQTAASNHAALLASQACGQLVKTLARLDTDGTPDNNDYVTGTQATNLSQQITALKTTWHCP